MGLTKSMVLNLKRKRLRSCQRKAKIKSQMMMRMAFQIGRMNTPVRMTIKNNES
jgi:hypothetical protein